MGELLLEPSQCWLQWQELVTLHTQLRTAWACSDGPLLLLCMCCPLAPELEGGQERGAVGPFLEREGRKCPSKGGCCSEPRSRQQSSVFALPGGKSPSHRVTPAALHCPSSVLAGTGHTLALAQTLSLPRVLPAAPTTPAHSRVGLPLPLPQLPHCPQLPFSGRAVSAATGS